MMRVFAAFFLIVAVIMGLAGVNYDVSVYVPGGGRYGFGGEVANSHAMHIQLLILIGAATFFMTGCILLALDAIEWTLRQRLPLPPRYESDGPHKTGINLTHLTIGIASLVIVVGLAFIVFGN